MKNSKTEDEVEEKDENSENANLKTKKKEKTFFKKLLGFFRKV